MPDGMSNLEVGENWWEMSQQQLSFQDEGVGGAASGYEFWNEFLSPFTNNPSSDNPSTWSAMLGYSNYFTPYNIDAGEQYRAIEQADISKGVLRNQFTSDKMPLMNTRIGSTGFASSGIRPIENVYDAYKESLSEANQESQAALNTVYEDFGAQLYDAVGNVSEQGMFDFESDEYTDIESNYDFSSYEGETFDEQVQACVENYYSTTYVAADSQNPQAFAEAMQYCHNQNYTGGA